MTFWKASRTFAELALQQLEFRKLKSRNTFLAATVQLTRLIQHFGKKNLRKITDTDWNQYVIAQQMKNPGRKMFDDRKYMRIVMLAALREGYIDKKLKLAIPDQKSDVGREITWQELVDLQACASSELRFQIRIAFKMGFRLREMLHMRWDQFNWSLETIRLLSSDTKTRRGREVPINPDLIAEFRERFRISTSKFVFPQPGDNSKPQNNNKTAWRRAKRLTGVKARWHDLRHTCASRMLRRGVRTHIASAYLGMSEKVLIKIYTHLSTADLRKAAKAMSDRR